MPLDIIESHRGSGLAFTYARLGDRRGHGDPTTTPRGQIGVAFTAHAGLVFDAAGYSHRVDAPPGAVYITGQRSIEWVSVQGPTEAVEIHVDPEVLAAAGAADVPDAFGEMDAVVFAAAAHLRAVHVAGRSLSDTAASTIGHRLAHHVARHYVGAAAPNSRRHRLSRLEVDAVYRFIRDQPGASLTLDVLAAQVHRSVFDFARAFRDTTGLPPHRFVTLVRMHHALELLRSGATVTAATDAVGYTSRYHFRRQFRESVSADPSDLVWTVAQDRSHLIVPAPRILGS